MVESVVCPVMEFYQKPDAEQAGATHWPDAEIGDVLTDVRHFATSLQRSCSKKEDVRRARELAEFSVNLRSAGDIVVTRLLGLAENKAQLNVEFSADGWKELVNANAKVMTRCPSRSISSRPRREIAGGAN